MTALGRQRSVLAAAVVLLATLGAAPTSGAPTARQASACRVHGFSFFRVTALRLHVTRTGRWRGSKYAVDAVERDTASGPGRDNVHPIPVSPPLAVTDCSGDFRVNGVHPAVLRTRGRWTDHTHQPAGVPLTGPCADQSTPVRRGRADTTFDLRAPVRVRGGSASFRLGLNLETATSCFTPARSENCPDGCDPADFGGGFDGSDHFFGADSSDDRFLPGRVQRIPVSSLLSRRDLTIRFSGRYVRRAPWTQGIGRRIGAETIVVAWTGWMTLHRFAHCRRGQSLRTCLPRGRP